MQNISIGVNLAMDVKENNQIVRLQHWSELSLTSTRNSMPLSLSTSTITSKHHNKSQTKTSVEKISLVIFQLQSLSMSFQLIPLVSTRLGLEPVELDPEPHFYV